MNDRSEICVLCVDDNAHDRALIRDALEREGRGFAMIEATDRESFEKALTRGGFDIVLTDFNILGFEGLEVIRAVSKRRPDVPVIVVTGTGSEEIAGQALKEGADDYVIKSPRHIAHLPYTILKVLEAWKTRHELEVWQANLKAIVENVSDGILVVDKDGTILFANPACEDLFGTSPEKLEGQNFGHPLSTGELVEINLPARKGGAGTAEMRAAPIQWGGQPCFVITLRDITERKQMEEVLRQSEARYRSLLDDVLDTSHVGVFILDSDFSVVWINKAMEEFFGLRREEVIGKDKRQLIKGKIKDIFADPKSFATKVLATYDDNTYVENFECHVLPGSGREERWLEHWSQPIRSGLYAGGRIEQYYDITRRIRAEQQRRDIEEQLRQAQKLESIGRLAGGVAHDFNNMLSIINGYAEILLGELYPNDPLRSDVEEILQAGKRAADLTRQLLAFSRKQTLQPKILDLNDVIRNINKMLRRLIGEDIDLELKLSDKISRVMADPGQIEQVIMNLAVNARDAMPDGGKLMIETGDVTLDESYARDHVGVQPGKYVLLAVSDTGCGMDEETLYHIFEPFFTTKERGKGTGLGLATVYGIVKQSGGNIWVYSEPGLGTTFKIYLPATEAKPEPEAVVPEVETERSAGEHILVVEDEENVRTLIANLLSRMGYKVKVAANAGEALLLVGEKGLQPDLVITDVVMPNISGKELINRLRKKHPDLKALFMSGYTDDAIVHNGVLDKNMPFIQKPFNLRDLTKTIRIALRRD